MIAAVYCRKSTEQSGVADEQKSVARQLDHARQYAARKGWTVDDQYIFVDDGISGAEFANRPGFLRLMNALKPRAPFQVLIMSEESRLGRESIETAYSFKKIMDAGARVFFYLDDRERTLDSPTEKIMLSLAGFADELEREKARQRTYDAMLRKFRNGHVVGSKVFGYTNHEVVGADGKRSHVERIINEAEAAVVRRVFELCAEGYGYTRIAKLLNAEGVPSPRPRRNRPVGWAPTSVYEVLRRPLYRGDVVWGRSRKHYRSGQLHTTKRPSSDWLVREAPELRIVSDELWTAAHARLTKIRERLEQSGGGRLSRRRDIDSRYLLPGFAVCASCGGGLGVFSRVSYGKRRKYVYGCVAHHKRGNTVCGNALLLPMDTIDDAVLSTLAGGPLRPAVVLAIVRGVLDELTPENVSAELDRLRADARGLDAQVANIATAIGRGGPLEALVNELTTLEARRKELRSVIAAREADHARTVDRVAINARVRNHLERWRALLTKHTADGRQLLREALAGPLRFAPEGRSYRFEGEIAVGRMLVGVAGFSDQPNWCARGVPTVVGLGKFSGIAA